MYPLKTKGFIQKTLPQQQANFGMGFGEVSMLIMQLNGLKQDLNNKLREVDEKIAKHKEITETAINAIEQTHQQAIAHIQTVKQGPAGNSANEDMIVSRLENKIPKPIDTEKLKSEILSQVPKIDEQKLTQKIVKAIPENKASLKVIQEQFFTDPMSVIDKILELANSGKFKLKTEHIDGLEQTISAFRHQITTKGYVHGGGDTVQAGTNITITTNSAGKKVINSSGGSGANWTSGTFTGDGVTTVFVLPTAATSYSSVFLKVQGQSLTDKNILPVGYDYTLAVDLKTITMVTAPLSTDSFIFNYS